MDFAIREGDLLFQDSDCGDFCKAIKKVTYGVYGLDFSHVGLARKDDEGNWVVLEAVSDGVIETPLERFLHKHLDEVGLPRVAVGRLKKEYRSLIPEALKHINKYLGKAYDQVFDIDNDSYYCSELVYFLFKEANAGQDVFHLEPMTFVDPDTGVTFGVWEDYYRKLGVEIPENKPGLNPGSISRSALLTIHFPFSSFDIKHPEAKSGTWQPCTESNGTTGN